MNGEIPTMSDKAPHEIPERATRRPYRSPRLATYGDVHTMTENNPGGPQDPRYIEPDEEEGEEEEEDE